MVNCIKQQREVHNGKKKIRCINREAETFMEIVQPGQCEGCPFAIIRGKNKQVPCKELFRKKLPVPQPDEEGYPPCLYRYVGVDGNKKCSITNLEVTLEMCKRCDEGVRSHEASNVEKVKHYFGAIRRWYALGKPIRSGEEVKKLFEEHCKGCNRYDPKKHACKNCGCVVSTKSSPLANKLAMASEHCPLGRF